MSRFKSTIRLATSDVFQGDAIGNFTLSLAELFIDSGFNTEVYARHYNQDATPIVRHFDLLECEIEGGDLLFAEYSIYEPGNELYRHLPNIKIVYYHGITPPEYFSGIDEVTEENCRKGIGQAECFSGFDYYIANSEYMLTELFSRFSEDDYMGDGLRERSSIVPPAINLKSRFPSNVSESDGLPFSRYFLYVGRLAPHKKIEDLLDWFKFYSGLDKNVGLIIVGGDAPIAYGDKVRALASENQAVSKRVYFAGHVSEEKLSQLYSRAEAFITLSKHEGFCVPLVEAMMFDVPVFASASAAIPETLGRSRGLLRDESIEDYAIEVYGILNDIDSRTRLLTQQASVCRKLVERSNGLKFLELIRNFL